MVLEQLNTSMEKINLEPYLTPHNYFKINHKFKHKAETIKLLEKDIGEYLCALEVGKAFLDGTPKALNVPKKIVIYYEHLTLLP